jgi:uncharacterized membrane protein YkoI
LVAYTGEKLAKSATINMERARAIALKARPGAITTKNWNRRRAAAVSVTPSTSRVAVSCTIGVDAQTGKVLENKKEGSHPD